MKGLDRSHYEISDLHTIFSMSYMEELTGSRDYGTGNAYTMLEAHTITLIERNPGITVTEISKIFGRSKSAISQLINRLQKKGLIIKARKMGESQKYKGLFVTAEGRNFSICHVRYDEIQVDTLLKRLLKEFTPVELNTIYRYMEISIRNKIGRPKIDSETLNIALPSNKEGE